MSRAVYVLWVASMVACAPRPDATQEVERLRMGPPPPLSDFARVLQERPIVLPEDHGPHYGYQTEWWYYTGNLEDAGAHGADGTRARFGYQLTLFRRGLSPGAPPDGPGLATNQIYFAHLAVSDVAAGRHRYAERFSRGATRLAGASGSPFSVWLEDWRVVSLDEEGGTVRLDAREGDLSLELRLGAVKPLVLHGYRGVSAKGGQRGNASFYLSYTRLETAGALTIEGRRHAVSGESWFDHEWGTSALGPEAVGWDWFSLQLGDQRELMFFLIRQEDGGLDLASSGTLVEPDGTTSRLRLSDVDLGVAGHWKSPESGARYPARWFIAVPSAQIDLEVVPWLEAQELRTSFTYWEGAVRLSGTSQGVPVTGHGYVELTGYARSMQGVF